jgi:5-methylcytosine-specific restriction endonuclease McrA
VLPPMTPGARQSTGAQLARTTPNRDPCPAHKQWPASVGRIRGRRWREIRASVLAAHAHRGAHCGAQGVPLEAHHVNHDHTDNTPTNLIPLCRPCHGKASYNAI